MIGVMSIATQDWKPLTDKTIPNHEEYCKCHGYESYIYKMETREKYQVCEEKFLQAFILFETIPELERLWIVDMDGIFTNMTLPCPEPSHYFNMFWSVDIHGANGGSIVVRNTKQGRQALNWLISCGKVGKVMDNDLFWEMFGRNVNCRMGLGLFDQRLTNSYNYALYPKEESYAGYEEWWQKGNWSKGDLFLHWPGLPNEKRIELADKYLKEVVR